MIFTRSIYIKILLVLSFLTSGLFGQAERIMLLGDSKTRGVSGSALQTGYRRPLHVLLTGSGYFVDFVGTGLTGIPTDFDRNHEGHSGWVADGPFISIADTIYDWLVLNPADIILLDVGTNDINDGDTPSQAVTDVETLLNEIDRYENDSGNSILVIIARTTNRNDILVNSIESQNVTAFNNGLQTLYENRISAPTPDNLLIIDLENGAGIDYNIDSVAPFLNGDLIDNLHPNDSGYVKTALVWKSILNSVLTPQIPSPLALLEPLNNSENQNTSLLLDWSPYAGAAFYRVQVATDIFFNSLAIDQDNISLSSLNVSGLNPATKYYWRVIAKSGSSTNLFYSEVWNFSTQTAPPQITSTPVTSGSVGISYTYDVNATGSPSPTYSLIVFPSGMTIDTTTGVINWLPITIGNYDVTVEAHNGIDPPSQQLFTIVVGEAPLCPPGIISYWKLDETGGSTYVDELGLNNAAATTAPTPIAGLVDGAQLFNGTNTGIDVPADPSFDFAANGSFSVEFWYQGSTTPTTVKSAVGRYITSTGARWWIGLNANDGKARFYMSSGGSSAAITGISITDGNWHHVAATRGTNGSMKIYVDGVLRGSTTKIFSADFSSPSSNLNIGWFSFQSVYALSGILDEVALHSVELSSTDIQEHYNNGLAGLGYCGSSPTQSAPVITSAPITTVELGQSYSYDVEASGNPAPTYSLVTFPSGMAINSSTGLISWNPASLGDFNVTVEAHNGVNPPAQQSFIITVTGTAPSITSTAVTNGAVGQLYSYDVNATGNPAPTYSLVIFPAGMTIDAVTGEINWTPDSAGNYDVTVEAHNGVSPANQQSFIIDVTGPEAPVITSTAILSATPNQLYTYDVDATGNPAPTYTLVIFPTGMTIDTVTGVISWTPTAVGEFNVTVEANNGVNPSDQQSYIITVTGTAPTITSTEVTSGIIGQLYSYDVNATGNPTPTYSLITFPTGMTIDEATGVISWIPSSTGNYAVTVEAQNGVEPVSQQSFAIEVGEAPLCPPGMISYWKLDETGGSTYVDELGLNNAAATTAPTPVAGLVNGAQLFNGTNTGIDVAADPSFDFAANGNFSVEFWYQGSTTPTTVKSAVGRYMGSSRWWVGINANNGRARFYMSSGGKSSAINGIDITDGVWHHVAATRNGTTGSLRIYVDGVLRASGTKAFTEDFSSTTAALNIGWFDFQAVYSLEGKLDEVAIHSVELSSTDIQQHYNNGLAGLGYCGSGPTQTAPVITSTPITTIELGQTYTYDVEATGNPSPTYSLVTFPAGMTINSTTGVIDWTPGSLGDYNVTVEANNGVNPPAQQSFTISVTGTAPSITSTAVTNGAVGQLYSYDVDATGNPAPVYSLTKFPSGMTIDPVTGMISWTPGSTGNDTVTVEASNGINPIAIQTYIITVTGPEAPLITSTAVTAAVANQLYNYDVDASGNPAPTYSLVTFPTGMTVDTETGVISWTPTSVGDFNVTVEANNGVNPSDQQSYIITVTGTAPSITSTEVTSGIIGQLYSYDVNATGNPTPTYTLITFPIGMTIDTITGIISWTPAAVGDYNVTVESHNGVNPLSQQSYTIAVNDAPLCPPGIISYWKLDETGGSTYVDELGTNNAVALTAPTPVQGIVNGAQQFNGSTTGIDVPANASYDFGVNDNFTIEYWYKGTTIPTTSKAAVGRYLESGSRWWIGLEPTSGKARFYLSSGGKSGAVSGGGIVPDGNWHHIVGTRNGTTGAIKIYTDGVLRSYTTKFFTEGFSSPTANINIGWFSFQSVYSIAGILDEVAIHNVELTLEEIQEHYNNGLSGSGYCSSGLAKSAMNNQPSVFEQFTTHLKDKKIVLSWQTSIDVTGGFEIERKNTDDKMFESIEFLNSQNGIRTFNYKDNTLLEEGDYSYRIKLINKNGGYAYSEVKNVSILPTEYQLFQNYPNPFNPITKIRFSLPKSEHVNIKIYTQIGEEVTEIVNQDYNAGIYEVEFAAHNLASGVYFYKMDAGSFFSVKKFIHLK